MIPAIKEEPKIPYMDVVKGGRGKPIQDVHNVLAFHPNPVEPIPEVVQEIMKEAVKEPVEKPAPESRQILEKFFPTMWYTLRTTLFKTAIDEKEKYLKPQSSGKRADEARGLLEALKGALKTMMDIEQHYAEESMKVIPQEEKEAHGSHQGTEQEHQPDPRD